MSFNKLTSFKLFWIIGLVGIFSVFTPTFAANPWDGMIETSILEKVMSTSDCYTSGTFKGYIQSSESADELASSYVKVVYSVTGTVSDDTEIFTLQPYNAVWEGWDNNIITIGDSVLDNGMYTAYMSVPDIKASLSSGTVKGINISFMENSGYEASILEYYYLAEESEEMTDRKRLKLSLDYIETMDSEKYQSASWDSFIKAVTTAESVYNASKTEAEYASARTTLEKAKSKLLFKDIAVESNPSSFREMSGDDTVYEMGVGWNLGNTMDGHTGFHPSETAWQSVTTTKEIIKAVHDAGFNTVRIPVTWGDMIDDNNNYAINDVWINRVQDIVDYCTSLDMYAIINIHHDGAEQDGWLRVAADDIDMVYEKFECVWRQIAEKFKDYDEHLIFESANELTCMEGDNKNSAAAIAKDTPVIVNLNQIFVNVVRSTGSNNTKRWLAAVSHYANGGTQSGFALPSDSYNSSNRIMFAAHIYKHSTKVEWTYDQVYEVVNSLRSMIKKHKVPIILGEYGNRNKVNSANPSKFNDLDRAYFDEIVTRACQVGKVVPCVWDQGWFDLSQTPDSTFSVWDREGKKPIFKSITDAMMRGVYLTPSSQNISYNMKDITRNPKVTSITDISVDNTDVALNIGERTTLKADTSPIGNNDVVLWKSNDDNIATVSRGMITAKKPGITTVTAFSQSNSARKDIKVTVLPVKVSKPITSIITDKESYSLEAGKYTYLNVNAEPIDTDAKLIYSSSNTNVATINEYGKIVGVGAGRTYINIIASNGFVKTVPVIVTSVDRVNAIDIAANVYYNDSKYASNEIGVPITVKEDGQYTLTFDTATDLSDAAKKAGINYLNNLTSIYIKDNAVTTGESSKTPLDNCEIRYDSIVVDGVPLTITKGGFKSALKENGVLDTNDPINGWDGSVVKEVTTSNHVVNFSTVTNPKKIEITFTLQNMKFTEETQVGDIPADKIENITASEIGLSEGSETKIKLKVSPINSTSLVSFHSFDNSIVIVDENAKLAESDGTLAIDVLAIGAGDAVVTAITDNGLSLNFNIRVGPMPFSNAEPVITDGVIATVNVDVHSIPDDEVSVLVAVYNSDDALVNFGYRQVMVDELNVGNIDISGFDVQINDGETAKAYIWNGLTNIEPLCRIDK